MNLDTEIQLQLGVKHRGNGSMEEAPGFTWGVREGFLQEVTLDQVLDCQRVQVSWERGRGLPGRGIKCA